MFKLVGNGGQGGRIWFAEAKKNLLGSGGEAAEIVEVGGLVENLISGKEVPHGVSKGVTNGEFGNVRWEFFIMGVVVEGDG